MNLTYFELPQDKQKKLMNAGYKVFALYAYKKASMSAIANEADISKSLLFYYFKNKKEYYLFLYDTAIEFFNKHRAEIFHETQYDLFELINQTIEYRMKMMHDYPYLFKFIARAYYETLEDIKLEMDKRKLTMNQIGKEEILNFIELYKFKDTCDVKILFDLILYAAEGCMRGREDLDIVKISEIVIEFKYMMESLKKHYYKGEYLNQQ
jgi:TetR/AcrR family transcriptional regulator